MSFIGKSPSLKSVKYTPQSSIPSNPSEGQTFYSDGTASAEGLYVYKNGAWVSVGSSASGINYITNPDAESGTTDWSEFDDGAVSTPVDGTGGTAANITLSKNTTTPLRGIADFKVAKGAADAQGEGVSIDFTIDNADKASVLQISFDYSVTANYADDDMGVWIYDVTNTNIIEVSNRDIKASSLSETHIATFQTASDSTSYRLIVMCKSTNASAYDFIFDNVSVGPNKQATASVVTDWEEFTPSFSNITVADEKGFHRRIGSNLEITAYASVQSVSSTMIMNMPSGFTIDHDRLGQGAADLVGTVQSADLSANEYAGVVTTNGSNNSFIFFGPNTASQWSASIPFTWAANDKLKVIISVPIQGWDSTAIVADEYASRSIFVEAEGNGGTVITANTTNIDWTEVSDNTASWDGTTFTVPSKGLYQIEGMLYLSSAISGQVQLVVGGSQTKNISGSSASNDRHKFSALEEFEEGDVVSIQFNQNATLSNSSFYHHLSIAKIKDSRSLLASEKVAARYTSNTARSINTSANDQIFEDIDFDTHNAYNTSTGEYTIPVSGIYNIKATITSATSNNDISCRILVNGTLISLKNNRLASSTTFISALVSDTLSLIKGDIVKIQAEAGNSSTSDTNDFRNNFSIFKI